MSEDKRHAQTEHVKLLRPGNSLRKKNVDRMYAKTFNDDMLDVIKFFGLGAVLFISNDDKARVPLVSQQPIYKHLYSCIWSIN